MSTQGAAAVDAAALPATGPSATRPSPPRFAHASEAELARILDFYAVRWEYEPHVFPILWSLEGVVVESFSPDFYLPDFDTYLELTTLRQPLVRKKNRKLRRLRELYPDVRIKLFYARDFRALMLKYGKLGLIDALSGTSGQVAPGARPIPDDGDSGHTDGDDAIATELLKIDGHAELMPQPDDLDQGARTPPYAARPARGRPRRTPAQPSSVGHDT